MPVSIPKAQAIALGENFLDNPNLGSSDKTGLIPKESASALELLAQAIIDKANENLKIERHHSSGALSESIHATYPEYINGVLTINIMALFYYDFINKGVRGTRGGAGLYSFKNEGTSKKMVSAIAEWLIRSGKSTENVNPKKTPIKLEQRRIEISKMGGAYAKAKSIKMYGIKATGFMDKAISFARQATLNTIGPAFKVDIINALPKKI